MAFDPNKPFEIVEQSGFDPGKPFEIITPQIEAQGRKSRRDLWEQGKKIREDIKAGRTKESDYNPEYLQSILEAGAGDLFERQERAKPLAAERAMVEEEGQRLDKLLKTPIQESVLAGGLKVAELPIVLKELARTKVLGKEANPEVAERLQFLTDLQAQNPLAGASGEALAMTATAGRPGGIPLALSRGQVGSAAKQFAVQAPINVGIGTGIREVLEAETTPTDIGIDIVTALGGGTPTRTKPIPSSIRKPEGAPVLTTVPEEVPTAPIIPSETPTVPRGTMGIGEQIAEKFEAKLPEKMQGPMRRMGEKLENKRVESQKVNNLIKETTGNFGEEAGKRLKIAADEGIDTSSLNRLTKMGGKEKALLSKMVDDLEKGVEPHGTGGQELVGVLNRADELLAQKGKVLNDVAQSLEGKDMVDVQDFVLKKLQAGQSMDRLSVDKKGNLNFAKTFLKDDPAGQKLVQQTFDEAIYGDAFEGHLKRQTIANKINLYSQPGQAVDPGVQQALKNIRQGLMDSLDATDARYKAANHEYAKIVQPLNYLESKFGNLRKSGEVGDAQMAERSYNLIRRLTSNAEGRAPLQNAIDNLQQALKANGIDAGPSMTQVSEAISLMERHFPETMRTTGFSQQIKTPLEQALQAAGGGGLGKKELLEKGLRKISQIVSKDEVTRRAAFKKLLKSLQEEVEPVKAE